MHRREFVHLVGATLAAGFSTKASAQIAGWPDKPIKLIVPYAPGGATDTIARPWADKLSQAFGQQFVIENRGGASGMIGTEAAAKSAPDGYTLLLTPAATLTVLPTLRKTPYDPFKSFTPIGRLADVQCGFVINPAAGPQTFKDMVEYAKKNPGKLAYGSSGPGTATHLRLEMLKLKAGIEILHVPYRGGAETLTDVLANNINLMNEPVSLPHAKAGKLILLNINHPQRSPDFPDVPTLAELGLTGADVPLWFALYGPAGLPKEIIQKLNAKIVEIAKADEIKSRLRGIGALVPVQTPEEMASFLAEDTKINGELIKAANIKLE